MAILAAALFGCQEPYTPPTPGGKKEPESVDPPIDVKVGQVLPAWQDGYLDIHSINGGRGEAFYYIFPDGTTMLCDAAGAPPAELHDYGNDSQGVPSKPSVSVSSGGVIVNYIKHFAPAVAGGRLDYFYTSHYHGDHIGAWRDNYASYGWTPFNKEGEQVSAVNLNDGGFYLNGIAEVGLAIPIDKVLDRGDWASRPSADYFDSGGQKRYQLYVNYLDYAKRKQGTARETLKIGHDDQVVLKHDAGKYSTFRVLNVAAGGDIWTGIVGAGYCYEDGTFSLDADYEKVSFQIRRVIKGTFDTVYLNVGDISQYKQWTYKTKCGVEVSIALQDRSGVVLANTPKGFVAINLCSNEDEDGNPITYTKAQIEDFVDHINFNKL